MRLGGVDPGLKDGHVGGLDGRADLLLTRLQALEYERLGPSREPYSDGRQRRLAVQEAATCVAATLLPSIEPVVYVTIIPREKYPMGQTVLKVSQPSLVLDTVGRSRRQPGSNREMR